MSELHLAAAGQRWPTCGIEACHVRIHLVVSPRKCLRDRTATAYDSRGVNSVPPPPYEFGLPSIMGWAALL